MTASASLALCLLTASALHTLACSLPYVQGEGRQGATALAQGVARRVGAIDMDLQVGFNTVQSNFPSSNCCLWHVFSPMHAFSGPPMCFTLVVQRGSWRGIDPACKSWRVSLFNLKQKNEE